MFKLALGSLSLVACLSSQDGSSPDQLDDAAVAETDAGTPDTIVADTCGIAPGVPEAFADIGPSSVVGAGQLGTASVMKGVWPPQHVQQVALASLPGEAPRWVVTGDVWQEALKVERNGVTSERIAASQGQELVLASITHTGEVEKVIVIGTTDDISAPMAGVMRCGADLWTMVMLPRAGETRLMRLSLDLATQEVAVFTWSTVGYAPAVGTIACIHDRMILAATPSAAIAVTPPHGAPSALPASPGELWLIDGSRLIDDGSIVAVQHRSAWTHSFAPGAGGTILYTRGYDGEDGPKPSEVRRLDFAARSSTPIGDLEVPGNVNVWVVEPRGCDPSARHQALCGGVGEEPFDFGGVRIDNADRTSFCAILEDGVVKHAVTFRAHVTRSLFHEGRLWIAGENSDFDPVLGLDLPGFAAFIATIDPVTGELRRRAFDAGDGTGAFVDELFVASGEGACNGHSGVAMRVSTRGESWSDRRDRIVLASADGRDAHCRQALPGVRTAFSYGIPAITSETLAGSCAHQRYLAFLPAGSEVYVSGPDGEVVSGPPFPEGLGYQVVPFAPASCVIGRAAD